MGRPRGNSREGYGGRHQSANELHHHPF
jgi:hypothetical protein